MVVGVSAPSSASAAEKDQAALEKEFEQALSGCYFRGFFTNRGQEQKQGLKEEKYTISSVKKLDGKDDLWVFNVRIQYGDHDVSLPLVLAVKWAGDTPVITLTDMLIPGLGKFTSRVVVYRGQYCGTWDGGDHGGHLFGKIEKIEAEKKATE
ncbi:MAG: hypothetical protein K8U03_19775 [Planctomycetia bacterium]|nr:hypothetical protein [Planctomycetia bacterium]